MKRFFKWFFAVIGGILFCAIVVVAWAFVRMEGRFDAVHDVTTSLVAVPTDAASIAEGERIARIRGCNGGCHGEVTGGNVFFEVPDGTRVVAPDLGRIAGEYSTGDLARVIRHGIKPDGTSVLAIMPSSMLYNLNDTDLGAVIAFLRSQSPADTKLPDTSVGPLVRVMMTMFELRFGWNIVAAEDIDHTAARPDADSDDRRERGRYLAMTSCSECHGDDLRGIPEEEIPSLAIVAAYPLDDFRNLMRTGKPVGGRTLELMKDVSLSRFAYFTDAELGDLHAYLSELASH